MHTHKHNHKYTNQPADDCNSLGILCDTCDVAGSGIEADIFLRPESLLSTSTPTVSFSKELGVSQPLWEGTGNKKYWSNCTTQTFKTWCHSGRGARCYSNSNHAMETFVVKTYFNCFLLHCKRSRTSTQVHIKTHSQLTAPTCVRWLGWCGRRRSTLISRLKDGAVLLAAQQTFQLFHLTQTLFISSLQKIERTTHAVLLAQGAETLALYPIPNERQHMSKI